MFQNVFWWLKNQQYFVINIKGYGGEQWAHVYSILNLQSNTKAFLEGS